MMHEYAITQEDTPLNLANFKVIAYQFYKHP
jgi:hypothetical protein